jgi:hypothetical protein
MCLDRETDRGIATTKRGKRIATSVDGTLTGLGGNLTAPSLAIFLLMILGVIFLATHRTTCY